MNQTSKLKEKVVARACFVAHYTAAVTAGVTDGSAIDRLGFNSAYLVMQAGDFSATSTTAFTAILNESETATVTGTLTGTWTPYDTANVTLSIYGTAVASVDAVFADLSGAKRYIAVAVTAGALGEASANITVTCILGDADVEPAT